MFNFTTTSCEYVCNQYYKQYQNQKQIESSANTILATRSIVVIEIQIFSISFVFIRYASVHQFFRINQLNLQNEVRFNSLSRAPWCDADISVSKYQKTSKVKSYEN